jgi:hypothetical protein
MVPEPLPSYITQYFWGDDLSQLTLENNQKYIIETLLEKGDSQAIHWLFLNLDKQIITKYLPKLKLSKKSKHFWNIYFA